MELHYLSTSNLIALSFVGNSRPRIKHAIKTGTAAVLAAICHEAIPFMNPVPAAWAALAAVIVMQSNIGNTWRASCSGFIGTIIGGLIGALVAGLGGTSLFWFWLSACGAVLLCSCLGLDAAVRLSGVTLALVMLSGTTTDPWTLGWQRSLDVALGIVASMVVQLLIWPSRADMELREELSRALEGCSRLYDAAVSSCLLAAYQPLALDRLRAEVEQRISRIRSLVQDLQNEPVPSREGDQVLIHLVSQVDAVEHHVSEFDFSAAEMEHDTYYRQMEAQLKELARATIVAFGWLATALSSTGKRRPIPDLDTPFSAAREAEQRLRQARVAANFGDDEILRFCTFFFSMQAISVSLRAMMTALSDTSTKTAHAESKKVEIA